MTSPPARANKPPRKFRVAMHTEGESVKLILGDMNRVYGTVADGGKHGALIIDNNEDGDVRALLRGCRRYPVDGVIRRLSNHDLLRTLPVRVRGMVGASVVEHTTRDQEEVNAWYRKALDVPDAVVWLGPANDQPEMDRNAHRRARYAERKAGHAGEPPAGEDA
jgi:hypothetical protein